MIPVSIDVGRGRAILGGLEIPLSEVRGSGEIRLGDSAGPLLRPLKFAERTRIVEWARSVPDPNPAVAASVAAIATLEPGPADPLVIEIVALHLAGAGIAAPSFANTMLLLARTSGWLYREIEAMDAAEADRLAAGIASSEDSSGGWMQFVFASRTEDSLESIRRRLAEDLLARGAGEVHLQAAFEPRDVRPEAPAAAEPRAPVPQQRVAPSDGAGQAGHPQVSSPAITAGPAAAWVHALDDNTRSRTHTHRPGNRLSARADLIHGLEHAGSPGDTTHAETLLRDSTGFPSSSSSRQPNAAAAAPSGFARTRRRSQQHAMDLSGLDIPRFPLAAPAAEPPQAAAAMDSTLDAIAAALDEESDLRGLL